jgi:hypothetical protein
VFLYFQHQSMLLFILLPLFFVVRNMLYLLLSPYFKGILSYEVVKIIIELKINRY